MVSEARDGGRPDARPGFVVRTLLDIRHAPDRMLHPMRRRNLSQRMRKSGPPNAPLFLCYGNVCRSPFAAAYFEKAELAAGGSPVRVRSAGFVGPDRPSPSEALAAAERHGVDLTAHRSQLVDRDQLRSSDLVVVMSAQQARRLRGDFPGERSNVIVLGDADPHPIRKRTILDPWNGDPTRFEESYERIVRCVDSLIEMSQVERS